MSNNETLIITIPEGISNVVIKYDNNVKPEINLITESQVIKKHKYTSLIGKLYLVKDNSYISRIFPCGSKDSNSFYDLYGKHYLIASDPYETSVTSRGEECYIRKTMIKVMDTAGRYYEVMYQPGWVID